MLCIVLKRAQQHGNIERVAVHAATVEELVAAEETRRKDDITDSNPWSVHVIDACGTRCGKLQVRFLVDDLGQFPGVDNIACQPDLAGTTFPGAMEPCLCAKHVAGGDQDGSKDDTNARHDTHRYLVDINSLTFLHLSLIHI